MVKAGKSMKSWERQAIIQDAHDIFDEPDLPGACPRLKRSILGHSLAPVEQPRPQKPMAQEQGTGDYVSG